MDHMKHIILRVIIKCYFSGIQFREGVFRGAVTKMLYCIRLCQQNQKDWDERCSA